MRVCVQCEGTKAEYTEVREHTNMRIRSHIPGEHPLPCKKVTQQQ